MNRLMGAIGVPLLILLWTGFPGQAPAEPVRIATGDWPPYASENSQHRGVATEIVTRTFRKMGVAVEVVFYPWARCYESVRTGRVWGAFPYARTEERAAEVDFSDTILYSASKLFYFDNPPENLRFQTVSDLKGYRIGGVSGYYYESMLNAASIDGDYAPHLRNGLEKLMLGRTDLFVANELVGWFLIHQTFPENAHRFGTLATPLDRHGLRMIVSRRRTPEEPLLTVFNKALAAVKDELFYRTLLEKLHRGEMRDGD